MVIDSLNLLDIVSFKKKIKGPFDISMDGRRRSKVVNLINIITLK